jgi:ribose transport system substrate-binding protein
VNGESAIRYIVNNKWAISLTLLLGVFVYLLGYFAYSFYTIQGIVKDIEDIGDDSNKPKHIVLISQELDNPFWRTVEKGARDATKKLNMQMEYIGPFRLNVEEQTKLLDKYIAAKVDGILIQGVQGEQYRKLINKAIDQNIPVVTVDTDVPDSKRVSHVGTDHYDAGRQLGELLIQSYGAEGNIGIILGSKDTIDQKLRIEGFRSVIDLYPNLKIIAMDVSNHSRIGATQAAETMLTNHKDLDFIIGFSSLDGLGIMQAVHGTKYQNNVKIFGFDDLPEIRQALAKQEIEASIMQMSYIMGQKAVQALHQYIEGQQVPNVQFIEVKILNHTNALRGG